MNRGRRAEEIFTERNDYELFLELLKETSVKGSSLRLTFAQEKGDDLKI